MQSGAVSPPARRGHAGASGRGIARILAVGNMYPPHHVGGYELVWQQAMRRATDLGHRVRVLTTDYRTERTVPDDPDVHRTLRWYWDLEAYRAPRLSLRERVALERHNAAVLRRHVVEFRPDVITWWSMGCMSLSLIEQARRRALPAVFVVHDDWLVYGPEYDQWLTTWRGPRRSVAGSIAERFGLPPTRVAFDARARWVFNSRYTRERAAQAGLDVADASVVHPGIDERFLTPAPPRAWRSRLLYVGRLDRQKGVDTAIWALAALGPQTTLDIWGTGEARYQREMEALAQRLGVRDRVRFRGFADSGDLPGIYAAADAVVFPVRWDEPFGLVPLEAMGVGRPVVTTARGGAAEYLRDGDNGLVFAADDAGGLAACVRRLADDGALRARLRLGGEETARAFSMSRFADAAVAQILGVA